MLRLEVANPGFADPLSGGLDPKSHAQGPGSRWGYGGENVRIVALRHVLSKGKRFPPKSWAASSAKAKDGVALFKRVTPKARWTIFPGHTPANLVH